MHFLDKYGKYGTTSTWNIYAHIAQKAHRTRMAPMAHMAQKTHKIPTERKAHRTS